MIRTISTRMAPKQQTHCTEPMNEVDPAPVLPPAPWLTTVFAALLFVAGALTAFTGLTTPPTVDTAAAPLPTAEFSVQPVAVTPPVDTPSLDAYPAAHPAGPAKGRPDQLTIPSLKITAPVVDAPLRNSELTIPVETKVGIYTDGAHPGATQGTILLAGHVSFNGHPGALHNLAKIQPRADIQLTDHNGRIYHYTVTNMTVVDKAALPTDIFDAQRPTPARLVIVTCGGPIITRTDGSHHFKDNVIITATAVGGS